MTSYTPSPSTSSKRHSFSIKPLNLSPTSTATKLSHPSSIISEAGPSSARASAQHPRRQSSISYITSPSTIHLNAPHSAGASPWISDAVTFTDSTLVGSSKPGALARSSSLGHSRRSTISTTGSLLKGDIRRNSTAGSRSAGGPNPPSERQRPPLTPVEKHAELLHYIAQKESLCLELRSQLAVHEAELIQLKRKWELIVSRGLDVPFPANIDYLYGSPPSSSSRPTATSSSFVLDGIREGVQGVGRLILGQPAASSTPAWPSGSSGNSGSRPGSIRNRSRHASALDEDHNARLSQSSTSSAGTNITSNSCLSKRASVMSTSTSCTSITSEDGPEHVMGDTQALMVQDTGASLTVSSSTAFAGRSFPDSEAEAAIAANSVSIDGAGNEDKFVTSPVLSSGQDVGSGSRNLRRRSSGHPSPTTAHIQFGNLMSPTPPSSFPGAERDAAEHHLDIGSPQPNTVRHNSSSNLPPGASIPGLSTLAMGVSGPLSEVGAQTLETLGKKWDELSKGSRLAKSQKRASNLFSDFVAAFSPNATTSPDLSLSSSTSSSSSLRTDSSSVSNTQNAPISLMDDNGDEEGLFSADSVLVPDRLPLSSAQVGHNKTRARASPTNVSQASIATSQDGEPSRVDDEEWNW